jgi:RNA polymerase primary sigma factor
MYMREMGTVELLTREGEIVIAKRIEDGLGQVLQALAAFPESTATLLRGYERVEAGDMRLNDLITGFVDPNADDEPAAPAPPAAANTADSSKGNDDDDTSTPVDTGPDPEEAKRVFTEMGKCYAQLTRAIEKGGPAPDYRPDSHP